MIEPIIRVFVLDDYLALIIFLALLLLVFLAYVMLKRARKNPYIVRLQSADKTQAKTYAYAVSKILRNMPQDELSEEIIKRLARYKYKKEVPNQIDTYTLGLIENFIELSQHK